jgi:hypothetical protein
MSLPIGMEKTDVDAVVLTVLNCCSYDGHAKRAGVRFDYCSSSEGVT